MPHDPYAAIFDMIQAIERAQRRLRQDAVLSQMGPGEGPQIIAGGFRNCLKIGETS